MNFFKKYWLVIIILVLGFVLRMINLDKPTGLWYDEMTLYSIASQKSLGAMMSVDSHRFLMFPIYFILYKFWLILFGNSDFTIRLMSVFFDVLAILTAYFVGRQAAKNIGKNDHKNSLGLVNMLFYALNSSFIYYAQEAKFYSLTFLLINLLILFWLKVMRSENKTNSVIFLIINFLLLYTYTSQALLILIVMAVTFVYWLTKNRFLSNLKLIFGWFAVFIPLIVMMCMFPKYYSGNFDAVVYDSSFGLLVLQNWFAPLLTGLQNNILEYHKFILMFITDTKLWLWALIPVLIVLILISKSVGRFSTARYIISIPIIYVATHMFMTEIMVYNTLVRYTLAALPFAVLCMAIGFDNLRNKKVKFLLLGVFIALNLSGVFSQYGAVSIKRPEGYKVLAQELIKNNIDKKENFILPIRPQLLDKYYIIEGNKYNLYDLNAPEAQETYLTKDEIQEISVKKDLYKNYKRYLSSTLIAKSFENYINETYMTNSNSGLVVLVDKSISMLNPAELYKIVNSSDYEKYPMQFMRLSKLNNDLLMVLDKQMKLVNYIELGNWEVFEFKKR